MSKSASLRLVFTLFGLGLATPAHAQDPQPPTVTPAPAPPVHSAPSVVGNDITVTVTEYGELPAEEARTVARILHSELVKQHSATGSYALELGKLGGKTLCTLVQISTLRKSELLLVGIDEITVAAPRLVEALRMSRPIEQTVTTENVVRQEVRPTLIKATTPGFYLGLSGMTALGAPAAGSGGFELGLKFRHKQIELGLHGRAGGLGSSDTGTSYVGLDLGANYNLLPGEFSPFVGGGFGFNYFNVGRENPAGDSSLDGSGLGAHVNLGVSLFRTSHVGAAAFLRADLPFYQLKGERIVNEVTYERVDSRLYVVPLSLNIGLNFQ